LLNPENLPAEVVFQKQHDSKQTIALPQWHSTSSGKIFVPEFWKSCGGCLSS
jgi:hypothetical protein